MNEIYLIINEAYFFGILEFIDKNNHIFINNIKYNFKIITKNKLKLTNGNIIQYLYTYDSFLYFDNIFIRNFIYKMDLIYNDGIDNIILNFKNNEIIRINNRNNGLFKLENNKGCCILGMGGSGKSALCNKTELITTRIRRK